MKGLLFKSLACLMILVVPLATVSAETAAAMLYSNGNFSLNGVSSPRSSAIMPGDRIDTRDAAVSITRSGTNVVIAPHSALIYRGDSVELASGAASIATSKGLAAQVQKIRIAPAAGSATYRVFRGDDQVLIAAVKGAVVVAGPAATRTVAEGATLAVPDPEPQKPGAIPGAEQRGAGWNNKAAAAVVLGALIATGIIVGIGVDKKCGPEQGGTAVVSPLCP